MQNDVANESISTASSAYMQVVGIVQSLAVGLLLQNAKLFQLLTADQINFSSSEFWLSFLQATVAFQLIVLTWHMNLQNVMAFKRAFGMWDSYIPFSFVFVEYFLILDSTPEKFRQWGLFVFLFTMGGLFAFTHVYIVSRKELSRNKAVFDLIGTYPFWVRIYISGIGLIALAGLLTDARQTTSRLILAGTIDASIFAFTFINTHFFWTPIVSAKELRRC
jgi:hypothetical protein